MVTPWRGRSLVFVCTVFIRTVFIGTVFIGTACGGTPTHSTPSTDLTQVAPDDFLLAYGRAHIDILHPAADVETAESEVRAARGAERRRAELRAAASHLEAAETARHERREARRHIRAAEQWIRKARRGRSLRAEADFVQLWLLWRAERNNAGARADAFTRRHRDAGNLTFVAWVLKGEIALASRKLRKAEQYYRFVLAYVDHPLYAFALYRTADVHTARGNDDEAAQTLDDVIELGCVEAPSPETQSMVRAAARARDIELQQSPDGVMRPASCDRVRSARDTEYEPPPDVQLDDP